MESSVSSRLASNFGAVPKGLKLIEFVQQPPMRESPEFRLTLPVPEFRSRNSDLYK